MNEIEAKEFLKEAFTAFPGVGAWIEANSPDPSKTVAIWARSLEQITITEAHSVLTRWSMGALPPPTGFQKEEFPLHVIAVVRRDRSEAKAVQSRDEVLRKHTGKSIFQTDRILGPFMANLNQLIRQFNAGTLSIEERNKCIADLEREAIAQVDQKTKYRVPRFDHKQAAVAQ